MGGTGLLGFILKLYKPSEANMLFDGASLVLYMCGVSVYIANIVKGLRTVTAEMYGDSANAPQADPAKPQEGELIGREDTLRVLAASNTILALVLVGVLVLQAGQWYAERKDLDEAIKYEKEQEEKAATKSPKTGSHVTRSVSKKKQ